MQSKGGRTLEKFIPKNKLSKKAQKEKNSERRKTWDRLSPVTRRMESKKAYVRKKPPVSELDDTRGCFLWWWVWIENNLN